MSNYTCKLPIEGSESVCILNSEWKIKDVRLLLLYNNQAWCGEFQVIQDEHLEELLDQLSLTEEQYVEESRNALTTHGGFVNFGYTIENDTFTWKKYVSKNMAVKFGYVTLSNVSVFEILENIIDNTIQSTVAISKRLSNTDQKKGNLEKENLDLKAKLNELTDKKNEMEKTLYSQFLYLLNEKKAKIRDVKKKLQPSDENELDPQNCDSDPYGSDTEIDTDEEDNQFPSKVDLLGKRESFGMETNKMYTMPKKSRKTEEDSTSAGPSGLCRKKINVKTTSIKSTQRFKELSTKQIKSIEVKKSKIKPERESCIMGKFTTEENVKNTTEEDVFMFPKRSSRINIGTKLQRPTTSKITYDSDNDETNFCKTLELDTNSGCTPSKMHNNEIKIEQDSDCTSSQMNVDNSKVTIVKQDNGNKLEGKNVYKNNINSQGESMVNNKNILSIEKSEITKNSSYKEFSSSTLDMLNQLV